MKSVDENKNQLKKHKRSETLEKEKNELTKQERDELEKLEELFKKTRFNPTKFEIKLYNFSVWYTDNYRKVRPFLLLLLALIITFQLGLYRYEKANRLDYYGYQSEIEKLDQITDNLQSLESFINQQRINLTESENILNQIKEERKDIAPLLEADKKVIDAIFLQQEKNIEAEKRESFWSGVLASLVAALIFELGRFLYFRRRKKFVNQRESTTKISNNN